MKKKNREPALPQAAGFSLAEKPIPCLLRKIMKRQKKIIISLIFRIGGGYNVRKQSILRLGEGDVDDE